MRQPNSIAEHLHRDEQKDRQQAELFQEWEYRATSGETPEEREVRLYYARPQVCTDPRCGHVLGMHDWPLGKCMESGCKCPRFIDRPVAPAKKEAA